ncbi:hypothetical protein SDC9_211869 [bioreactor metagenome]|uniref:Uncharacterized protein n=1 Tax=bioreactor metagenome TaxID=1076179 RepID=A0A645JK98_9ZZZZ
MPVGQGAAVQQVDHPVGDKAATVIPVVDDKCFFMMVGIHAPEELAVSFYCGVRHVDIADSTAGEPVHHFPALVHPVHIS